MYRGKDNVWCHRFLTKFLLVGEIQWSGGMNDHTHNRGRGGKILKD